MNSESHCVNELIDSRLLLLYLCRELNLMGFWWILRFVFNWDVLFGINFDLLTQKNWFKLNFIHFCIKVMHKFIDRKLEIFILKMLSTTPPPKPSKLNFKSLWKSLRPSIIHRTIMMIYHQAAKRRLAPEPKIKPDKGL